MITAKRSRKRRRVFARTLLAAIDASKTLGIRAGTRPHRVIGIWVVVVAGRVFVRSWDIKERGWYRTFLDEPEGVIHIAEREVAVRASRAPGERLQAAIDRAYAAKYNTPGSLTYVRGFARGRRRATTTELTPL